MRAENFSIRAGMKKCEPTLTKKAYCVLYGQALTTLAV
jgi:hypothetical protein